MLNDGVSFCYTKDELNGILNRSSNYIGAFIFLIFVAFIGFFGFLLLSWYSFNKIPLLPEVMIILICITCLYLIFLSIFTGLRLLKNMKRWYTAKQRMYIHNGVFMHECGEHTFSIEKNRLIKIVVSKHFCKLTILNTRFDSTPSLYVMPQIPLRILSKNQIMELAKELECKVLIFKKSSGMRQTRRL